MRTYAAVLFTFLLFAFLLVGGRAEALVVTDADEDTRDFIILYSAGYYMSVDRHPNFLGTFAAPVLNQIGEGEDLVMVAHGEAGLIGDMTGDQLATWLTANDIPGTAIDVFLNSCESGIGDQESLAATAAEGSTNNLAFIGYLGCAVTSAAAGGEVVIQPDHEDAFNEVQAALIAEKNPKGEIEQIILEYQAAHDGANPPLATLAQLAYQSVKIGEFFTALLAQGGPSSTLPERGTSSTRTSSQV